MRVIVCGGRDYDGDAPWNHVMDVLGDLHRKTPISAIIEGGARGADSLAKTWALMNGVKCVTVPANWALHGTRAGPIRNARMLHEFSPDLVVAFPGGKGTANMIQIAEQAGIPVSRFYPTVTANHVDK